MITYAQRMDAVKAENARLRPAEASTDFKVWLRWIGECHQRLERAEQEHLEAARERTRRMMA